MKQRIKDDIEFMAILIFGIAGLCFVFGAAFYTCFMQRL